MKSFLLCCLAIVCTVRGFFGSQPSLTTIFFRVYTGTTIKEYSDVQMEDAEKLLPYLNLSLKTVMYVHGFSESVDSVSVQTIVTQYLCLGNHNIIATDYSKLANQSYVASAASAVSVGRVVGTVINKLVMKGLNPEKFYLVGHSLGGQTCGYIARKVDFLLKRLTALDPAGPLFTLLEQPLAPTDAEAVIVIHTDRGFYGNNKDTGTVNFYPNDGCRIQPGCPSHPQFYSSADFCSHHRSWKFYAESICNQTAFYGVKCDSETSFKLGKCNKNQVIPMGIATPGTGKGRFYLRTGDKSPFGLGEAGAMPAKKTNFRKKT